MAPTLFFTLALKTDSTIWAWGLDDVNQTGNSPSNESQSTPIQVGTATDWIDVAAGVRSTAFALKADGTFLGWGFNQSSLLASFSSVVSVGTLSIDNFSTHFKGSGTSNYGMWRQWFFHKEFSS